ncbi:MAG: efflux RND transporter periplasmic adaptor subunit [Candidatus Magnetomorum sp.]|nr:efflux RND transporter periplasmic adaptor subunit [Candidatus Magnetomorum sp.]
MNIKGIKLILWLLLIFGGVILAHQTMIHQQVSQTIKDKSQKAVPVEVTAIRHGPITLSRTFSGTIEAQADFVVAPKVDGRIKQLTVELADTVQRGQLVAELDNEEYVQAVAQAKADIAVAKANLAESVSALEIANRDFDRVKALRQRGITSDSKLDETKANQSTIQAKFEVAKAQMTRAEALLEMANIRLGYTKIKVDWSGGDDQRIVAERFVDEGHMVSGNTPLFRIVELNPIIGVIFITEKDYARIKPAQIVQLTTDAYPEEIFEGHVIRISPVFRNATRQARVELTIANPLHRLKPGMFARVTVEFEKIQDAVIVPEQALTKRADHIGIFVVNENNKTVTWRTVKVGIQEGERVQVMGEGLSGRVITLGHQLVDDGSLITIPDENRTAPIADGENKS